MPSFEPAWPALSLAAPSWPSKVLMERLTAPIRAAGSRGPSSRSAWLRADEAIRVMKAPGTPCPVQSAMAANQPPAWRSKK